MSDDPIGRVVALLNAVAATRDPALVLTSDARHAAVRLSELLAAQDDNLEARHVLGWWHWYRYLALPEDEDQEAWDTAAHTLTKCFVADVSDLPEPLIPVLAHYAADEAEDLLADAIEADDARALATAATLWRRIVAATPPENPHLAAMLANLAVVLQARYRWSADSSDLDEAIAALRRAVALSHGDPPEQTAAILSNLAGALSARFAATGHTDKLDEAIQIMRQVLTLVPSGNPAEPTYQSNLSAALAARFERRGARTDLDEAVSGLIEASSTTVGSAPSTLSTALSSLGVLVRLRFDRTGEDAALDLAVKIGRLAEDALPPSRTGRHRVLSNLAGTLRCRAERTGVPGDFAEAVEVGRDAVACTPLGDEDAAQTRSNLGDILRSRYERLGEPEDLDEAIQIVQEVIAAWDGEGPASATYLANLGSALTQRHRRLGAQTDLEGAVDALARAASIIPAPPSVRVRAGRGAAALIARRDPASAASLLESAVVLVPRIVSRHLGRQDQEFALRESAGLGCDAAAMALTAARANRDLSSRPVGRSLRLLELGRGVVLGQLLDARDDLADLRARHPRIARRVAELRAELDRIGPLT
jgi:tetratricopeptide (TPR) repeat protein